MNMSEISKLTEKLLPITELRRNAGRVLAKLEEVGYFIVTKDGKPIAELTPIGKRKRGKRFIESKGAWKGTGLEKIDLYSLILEWRKKGTRRKPFRYEQIR